MKQESSAPVPTMLLPAFLILLLGAILMPGLSGAEDSQQGAGSEPGADSELYFVPPPPLSEETWPCSDCHGDMEPDPTPRKLDMHEEIQASFNHAPEQRWCLDCHNANDRDYLRLANGDLVEFAESYKLCGQCHGTIYRDWKAGVHGRRTGYWNGRKEYRLCVVCHNPHHPRFQPITPLPAPQRPGEIANVPNGGKTPELPPVDPPPQ